MALSKEYITELFATLFVNLEIKNKKHLRHLSQKIFLLFNKLEKNNLYIGNYHERNIIGTYFDFTVQENTLLSVIYKMTDKSCMANINREIALRLIKLPEESRNIEEVKQQVMAETLIGLIIIYAKIYCDTKIVISSDFMALANSIGINQHLSTLVATEHFVFNNILHWDCHIEPADFVQMLDAIQSNEWVDFINARQADEISTPYSATISALMDDILAHPLPDPVVPNRADDNQTPIAQFSWRTHKDIYFNDVEHAKKQIHELLLKDEAEHYSQIKPKQYDDITECLYVINELIEDKIAKNEALEEKIVSSVFSNKSANQQHINDQVKMALTQRGELAHAKEYFERLANKSLPEYMQKTWQKTCDGLKAYASTLLPNEASVSDNPNTIMLHILLAYSPKEIEDSSISESDSTYSSASERDYVSDSNSDYSESDDQSHGSDTPVSINPSLSTSGLFASKPFHCSSPIKEVYSYAESPKA